MATAGDGVRGRSRAAARRLVAVAALSVVACALPALPALARTAREGSPGMRVLCNRADYGCVTGTGYHGQGVWGANWGATGHNCTSYVSYRLSKLGVRQPWRPMGDAGQWDDNARGRVPVDDVPAVGAVAQWEGGTRFAPNPSGHVAYVEAVSSSGIEITDDTHSGGTRRVRISRGSPYWPDDFVHIHDVIGPDSVTRGGWALTNAQRPPLADPVEVAFGQPGDIPIVGDWDGDGDDTVGVYRNGTWILARRNRAPKGEPIPVRTLQFGEPGDVPVVGDWDGDGDDTVGVYRDGLWILSDTLASDPRQTLELRLGDPGDTPVVGDWDGVGGDTVGVFRDGRWTLTNASYAGTARRFELRFGAAGDRPVRGNWDGVRGDTIGLYRNGTWLLPASNSDLQRVTELELGSRDTKPVVGNWDGGGSDTIGVVR